jgi:hypothetical protein
MSIILPQSLISSLQATFDNEARRIAKDAAKILKVPEKEVLQIIKTSNKVQFKIINDDETPSTCPVFKTGETFLSRCRTPCVLGTGRCIYHQKQEIVETKYSELKMLTRVKKLQEADADLWCDEETQDIYNSSGQVIGNISDDCIEIYEYEE